MTYEEEFEERNLPDVFDPTIADERDDRPAQFEDGWYSGTFEATYARTTRDGNEQTFATEDVPSQDGGSRNIWLRAKLTRKSDQAVLNMGTIVNYRPGYLTAETKAAIEELKPKVKAGEAEWGSLNAPRLSRIRIGSLLRIAGLRQFEKNGQGGLDVTPLVGKSAYFRIGADDRKPEYKKIYEFSEEPPKRKPVL